MRALEGEVLKSWIYMMKIGIIVSTDNGSFPIMCIISQNKRNAKAWVTTARTGFFLSYDF